MNQEDVQKLSNAANAKITLLKNDFFKYFMRAIMAGFFIVVAMIFSNVSGKCVLRGRRTGMGGNSWGARRVLDCSVADFAGRRRAFYRE